VKTSLDIPDQELADVLHFSKAKTKRDAVVTAITEYNRRHRMAELIKYSGTSETMMTNDEIEALEEAEEHNQP
jgi:Bacterial antitoxin of type II TA system, VapB